jgi:hypothetical protein
VDSRQDPYCHTGLIYQLFINHTMKNLSLVSALLCMSFFANAQSNVINQTGPVGIGTTTPVAGSYLHVYRNVAGQYGPLIMVQDALSGGFSQLGIKGTARTFHLGVGNTGAAFGLSDKFYIWDQNASLPRIVVDANGSVGIGTTNINATYKLFVEGAIRTRKVKVDQLTWPDFVFDKTYRLLPLTELEKFIAANHHLPDVPSAATVAKDGLDLGDNQATLLKKIEELTLYLIEQNKRIDAQDKTIEELKSKCSTK